MKERGFYPSRSRRFNARLLLTGGPLSGLLGLAVALALRSWVVGSDSGVGPTAAALDEAFSLLYGAAIGLAVGAACVAFAAGRGSRVLTGTFGALLGYASVLAPALIISAPSDVSIGESVFIAIYAGLLLLPATLVGAAVGAAIGEYQEHRVSP